MSELNEEQTSPEKSESTAEERQREILLWLTEWQKENPDLFREWEIEVGGFTRVNEREINITELAKDLSQHPIYAEFLRDGQQTSRELIENIYSANPDSRVFAVETSRMIDRDNLRSIMSWKLRSSTRSFM